MTAELGQFVITHTHRQPDTNPATVTAGPFATTTEARGNVATQTVTCTVCGGTLTTTRNMLTKDVTR